MDVFARYIIEIMSQRISLAVLKQPIYMKSNEGEIKDSGGQRWFETWLAILAANSIHSGPAIDQMPTSNVLGESSTIRSLCLDIIPLCGQSLCNTHIRLARLARDVTNVFVGLRPVSQVGSEGEHFRTLSMLLTVFINATITS